MLVLTVLLAAVGCGAEEYRYQADWEQLSFPPDVVVADPVEIPSGVTPEFVIFSAAAGPRDTSAVELTRRIALHLGAQGWEVRGSHIGRRGFYADAPDSIDVASVVPLRPELRRTGAFRGRVGRMLAAFKHRDRAVLIRLKPPEQAPF